ncbi:protoporphyrinogen/coproporphyrinogen oxidase [Microbacterium sp. No. 7]|uniref:protoporphyrinogen/coproporphyrinogen oxidase n=1 Tax=Microbacterium sp. No. 7 TaxID=1714373 RepID=UPI0006ED42E2|nr:FAD-dependent oxidoreductase [Microbacterium sp. No. 7]ALJ19754.1 hypothetical protein AOA12_07485 [Microbacterium sp. No. 7]
MTHDLVIVGGGVAGLVVAYDAARAGLRVRLYEADDDTGGLLRRGDLDGIAVDLGAESFATRTSGVAALAAELGLPVMPPRAGSARLIVPGDAGDAGHAADAADPGDAGVPAVRRAPLPRRTVVGIPADPLADDVVRIIGAQAARRAADEISAPVPAVEPSLAALVAERCGRGLVERLVDPLCQSVYSRPADRVRLSRINPALWAAFVETGSLRAAAARVASAAPAGAAVAGVVGGMWRLPAALRERAVQDGADIRTGVRVHAVEPGPGGVEVRAAGADGDETVRAERVVIATGPAAARRLLGGAVPDPPGADAPGHAVRLVSALVTSSALDGYPVGSGAIVADGVASAAKALTHTTAKWPWADLGPGRHLVRLSARDAAAAGLDTPAAVARELTLLTGVPVAPADIAAMRTVTWSDAVVTDALPAATVLTAAQGGIHLAGAVVAGTGLASVVPHARDLARHLTLARSIA